MAQLQINRAAKKAARPDKIFFEITATKEEKKLINLIYKFNSYFVKMISAKVYNRSEDWNFYENQRDNIIDDIMSIHSQLGLLQEKNFTSGILTFRIPEKLKSKFHFKKSYQGSY
jgi:hypothetical protein